MGAERRSDYLRGEHLTKINLLPQGQCTTFPHQPRHAYAFLHQSTGVLWLTRLLMDSGIRTSYVHTYQHKVEKYGEHGVTPDETQPSHMHTYDPFVNHRAHGAT